MSARAVTLRATSAAFRRAWQLCAFNVKKRKQMNRIDEIEERSERRRTDSNNGAVVLDQRDDDIDYLLETVKESGAKQHSLLPDPLVQARQIVGTWRAVGDGNNDALLTRYIFSKRLRRIVVTRAISRKKVVELDSENPARR